MGNKDFVIIRLLHELEKTTVSYIKYYRMLSLLRQLFLSERHESKSWEDCLFEALDTLSEREKKIVKSRWGLEGGEPQTLSQVAETAGVSKERIRQIEAKAFRKLRHPSRRRMLLGDSWQVAAVEAKEAGQTLFNRDISAIRNYPLPGNDKPKRDKRELQLMALPPRIVNPLIKAGYTYVYEVKEASDEHLLRIRGIGHKVLSYLRLPVTFSGL